jgi:DNA-directed RNA polymerase subunit RPC12/RpoP
VNIPAFTCPECGNRHIRRSRYQNVTEHLGALFGVYPFRCRDCGARFQADVLMLKRLLYAKCPRCLRMQLTTWSRQFYQATWRQNVALILGAQRYRCSTCRYNFVAFRPRLRASKGTRGSIEELYEEEETKATGSAGE